MSTLDEILHPQSIAIAGASSNPDGQGYGFTSPLLEFGFKGKIYPVNPKYPEILGLKTYPSLRDIPGPVDYVISCVPAGEVLDLLADCSQKGVNALHLYTARFSETGRREATELEQELLRRARKWGIRLIGPNCMGVYYPRHGISYMDDFPKEPGTVGVASQSGNINTEFVRAAGLRGVRFSKAISYGNALDFNECDFLDYFSRDPETKSIVLYVEGMKDGRRFFNTLRRTAASKPVIIMKGGRGQAGTRATASHTASLAGSMRIWETIINQTGAVAAESLEEMTDLATSFYFLPPIRGRRVGIAGGPGGASVMAADQCEEAGLEVVPLPPEIREELRSKGISIWDWLSNPADTSITGDTNLSVGEILQMMSRNQNFDLLIATMGMPFRRSQQGTSAEKYLERYQLKVSEQKPLLAIVADKGLGSDDYDNWMWKLSCEVRTRLITANIPFYPSIGRAARAASKLIDYYQKWAEG